MYSTVDKVGHNFWLRVLVKLGAILLVKLIAMAHLVKWIVWPKNKIFIGSFFCQYINTAFMRIRRIVYKVKVGRKILVLYTKNTILGVDFFYICICNFSQAV